MLVNFIYFLPIPTPSILVPCNISPIPSPVCDVLLLLSPAQTLTVTTWSRRQTSKTSSTDWRANRRSVMTTWISWSITWVSMEWRHPRCDVIMLNFCYDEYALWGLFDLWSSLCLIDNGFNLLFTFNWFACRMTKYFYALLLYEGDYNIQFCCQIYIYGLYLVHFLVIYPARICTTCMPICDDSRTCSHPPSLFPRRSTRRLTLTTTARSHSLSSNTLSPRHQTSSS